MSVSLGGMRSMCVGGGGFPFRYRSEYIGKAHRHAESRCPTAVRFSGLNMDGRWPRNSRVGGDFRIEPARVGKGRNLHRLVERRRNGSQFAYAGQRAIVVGCFEGWIRCGGWEAWR
jgi:hypothetical protein